jgi:6-phosphogluconolactonase
VTTTHLPRRRRILLGTAALAICLPSAPAVATPPASTNESVAGGEHVRPLVVGGFVSPAVSVVGTSRGGELSAVPGSPFPAEALSLALAITPDGKKVYSASNATGQIVGRRIAPDGTLGPLEGGTITELGSVSGLAITPDGRRAFATVAGAVRSYDIDARGALTPTGAAPGQTGALSQISQVAIVPSGRHLVVTNYLSDSVTTFAIGSDATLTRVGTAPTGAKPVMPAFTPDGRFLYVSNESGASVSGYAVGSDGGLTPLPGSPYATPSTPHGVAIAPDGRTLYVPSSGPDVTAENSVIGFRIGSDGSLAEQLPGSPYRVSGAVGRVVLSPDASRMYVVEGVGDVVGAPAPPALPLGSLQLALGELPGEDPLVSEVHSYAVREDGSIAPSGHPSISTGLVWSDGSTAFLVPNQGPIAALQVVGRDGRSVTYSAEDSTDQDGTIVRYDWDFGDGTRVTTTTPFVSHRYARTGARTATVTVTDDEGCSTTFVYTGTTATCTGSAGARASTTTG